MHHKEKHVSKVNPIKKKDASGKLKSKDEIEELKKKQREEVKKVEQECKNLL